MITWLSVPTSQEASAKRKGAQKSLDNGRWFVQDVANLKPFLKWIPTRLTAPTTDTAPEKRKHKRPRVKLDTDTNKHLPTTMGFLKSA
jgi:hypothetical protein